MIGDGLGEGYGMLGQAGSGKLRVSVGQSKLAAKAAKRSISIAAFYSCIFVFLGLLLVLIAYYWFLLQVAVV